MQIANVVHVRRSSRKRSPAPSPSGSAASGAARSASPARNAAATIRQRAAGTQRAEHEHGPERTAGRPVQEEQHRDTADELADDGPRGTWAHGWQVVEQRGDLQVRARVLQGLVALFEADEAEHAARVLLAQLGLGPGDLAGSGPSPQAAPAQRPDPLGRLVDEVERHDRERRQPRHEGGGVEEHQQEHRDPAHHSPPGSLGLAVHRSI